MSVTPAACSNVGAKSKFDAGVVEKCYPKKCVTATKVTVLNAIIGSELKYLAGTIQDQFVSFVDATENSDRFAAADIFSVQGRAGVIDSDLGSLELGFCASGNAALSIFAPLTELRADFRAADMEMSASISALEDGSAPSDRVQTCRLTFIEKFSAEEQMARSDLTVKAANPKTRSARAAASPITKLTVQHCWAAAF